MKALLLAAGYGTRLRPLTEHIPKPLTLFMGRPILDIVYDQVRAAGLDEVAVNTHHLASVIAKHTQTLASPRQPIHISYEPEILGTGGSINPLRDWLGEEDLLIYNGDIVSSVDLLVFKQSFIASGAKAGMVLIPHKDGTTPVFQDGDRVVGIGGSAPLGSRAKTFAGIHIISRAFIEAMPREGFFSVIDTYQKLLASGEPIFAHLHDGYWADLGIPRDYLEAHEELWRSPNRAELLKALHLDPKRLDYDEAQQSLFIDAKRQAGIRRSFVFGPLAKGDGDVELDQCIVYPGVDMGLHRRKAGMIISPYACLNLLG